MQEDTLRWILETMAEQRVRTEQPKIDVADLNVEVRKVFHDWYASQGPSQEIKNLLKKLA